MCVCSGSVDGTVKVCVCVVAVLMVLEIKQISSFQQYLSFDSTKTFVSTLVLSWPDYGNALHAGPPVLLDKE